MKRLGGWILAALAIVVAAIVEPAWTLLFGWFVFIKDTLPRATVSVPALISGTVVVVLFVVTLHAFGVLTCRAASTPERLRPWRWKWTLSLTLLLAVMFASGFATIALARHIGWLASSSQSFYGERVEYVLD